MNVRKNSALMLICAALSSGGCFAYNFPFPDNRIGWVDASGYLSILIDEGWRLPVADKEEIPIRFQFCSRQERVANGCLGEGWWFPLLESTVVEEAETYVRMSTLGGRWYFLHKDPKQPHRYVSPDFKWIGTVGSAGRFEVKGPDGWLFEYLEGRLTRATSPSGSELIWRRREGRVAAIESAQGKTLLEVRYNTLGKLDRLVTIRGAELAFQYGQFPRLVSLGGNAVVAAIVPYMSKISVNDGFEATLLPGKLDSRLIHYELTTKKAVDAQGAKTPFTWASDTGILAAAGNARYGVEPSNQRGGLPRITVHDVDSGQLLGAYHWDVERLTATRTMRSGAQRIERYIGTPGPAYYKVTSIETSEGFSFKCYYDQAGAVLRTVTQDSGMDIPVVTERPAAGVVIVTAGQEREIRRRVNGGVELVFETEGSPPSKLFFKDGRLDLSTHDNSRNQ